MPVIHILYGGTGSTDFLTHASTATQTLLLIVTVLVLWMLFGITWASTILENTGLKGIGFRSLRLVDFFWAIAFFLGAVLLLVGLAYLLARFGFEIPGEVALLIPKELGGKLLWVVVSFTAGFCEEAIFRGYLMTRIRLLGKFSNWVVPAILSALIFGSLHGYEGIAGVILITIYGLLLSLLYIRTGSIWPCVIAHFFQDVQYVIVPQY